MSSAVSRLSFLMSSSTLSLFFSVEAVWGPALRGWSEIWGVRGGIRVSILKMSHPSSNTASTRPQISIHALRSLVNFCCGGLFSNQKFDSSTPTKRNIVVGHFVGCASSCVITIPGITLTNRNAVDRRDPGGGTTAEAGCSRRLLWASVLSFLFLTGWFRNCHGSVLLSLLSVTTVVYDAMWDKT